MARIKIEHFLLDVGKKFVTSIGGAQASISAPGVVIYYPADGLEIILNGYKVSSIDASASEGLYNVIWQPASDIGYMTQYKFDAFVDIVVNQVTRKKVF